MSFSESELRLAVANSVSILGTIRNLGIYGRSGSVWNLVRARIDKHGIDASHFLGKNHRRGIVKSIDPKPILIHNPNLYSRESTKRLRRALITVGVPYICLMCSSFEWNGKPLGLDVDHIDGNWRNNTQDNLRFLCPNCHSQQKTSGRRSQCERCGDRVLGRKNCSKCAASHASRFASRPEKGRWPPNLEQLLDEMPITKIADIVGVTEAAVRKRAKRLGIKTKPQGFWSKRTIHHESSGVI